MKTDVYDPAHFNDRLLLGLKGTMSEAELHVIRARLQGGILNKARRGELQCPLPVGFVYNASRAARAGPGQTGAGKHSILLRHIPAHRYRPALSSKPSARRSFCFRDG